MSGQSKSSGTSHDTGMNPLGDEMLSQFGLDEDPFASDHDPKFLLRSTPLRNALESVHHNVGLGRNLIVIVGESGAGKSALVDALSREFKDRTRTARISKPSGRWAEIGQEIGTQLRMSGGRLSPGAMAAEGGMSHTYRVVVNHAEQLSVDSIKHFAAYLDLQPAPGKLVHRLQIILLAEDRVGAPLFTWLTNREHVRIDLELLGAEQTRRYVSRRVQIAQSVRRQIFSSDALDRIAQLSVGNPAAINRLCRAALELAASRGSVGVNADTIGTAARRVQEGQAVTTVEPEADFADFPPSPPYVSAPLSPSPVAFEIPSEPAQLILEPVAVPRPAPRVEVVENQAPHTQGRASAIWAAVCALLLGVIAGGAGFLYFEEPAPAPEPVTRIVEVPVEVEKIVEVPVEVVKIVKVQVAPKPKPKPRIRRPAKVVKALPAKPAPVVVVKKPEIAPMPLAATVLDRAFVRSRPGDHSRLIEILKHGDDGAKLTQTLKLARVNQKARTLTVGVLTGDVSGNEREVESRFLSIETGAMEDERFGFRPARGKLEALKGGQGRDPFYGNSFHYDDFRVRTSDQFVMHGIERSKVENQTLYVVSVKPRYRAKYERVEFVIDAKDYALVEAHYFKGLGLRPYRVLQYPRGNMKVFGSALVPMRIISRDFENSRVDEVRVVKLSDDKPLDRKLFTLTQIQSESLEVPNL